MSPNQFIPSSSFFLPRTTTRYSLSYYAPSSFWSFPHTRDDDDDDDGGVGENAPAAAAHLPRSSSSEFF